MAFLFPAVKEANTMEAGEVESTEALIPSTLKRERNGSVESKRVMLIIGNLKRDGGAVDTTDLIQKIAIRVA